MSRDDKLSSENYLKSDRDTIFPDRGLNDACLLRMPEQVYSRLMILIKWTIVLFAS